MTARRRRAISLIAAALIGATRKMQNLEVTLTCGKTRPIRSRISEFPTDFRPPLTLYPLPMHLRMLIQEASHRRFRTKMGGGVSAIG